MTAHLRGRLLTRFLGAPARLLGGSAKAFPRAGGVGRWLLLFLRATRVDPQRGRCAPGNSRVVALARRVTFPFLASTVGALLLVFRTPFCAFRFWA